MTQDTVAILLTAALMLGAFFLFFLLGYQTERGRAVILRPIPAFGRIRRFVRQSAETGTRVHISPGTGTLTGAGTGGASAADTLNGLIALEAVAEIAARTSGHAVITTDDALTLAAAQNIVAGRYNAAGRKGDYVASDVRLVAPTTTTTGTIGYIAGAQAVAGEPAVQASAALGAFGDEYLLLGDTLRARHLPQVAGSTREQGAAVMLLAAGPENTLIGEEVFAAPAYLDGSAAHLASLRVQDWLRGALIGGIVVGVVLRTIGVF